MAISLTTWASTYSGDAASHTVIVNVTIGDVVVGYACKRSSVGGTTCTINGAGTVFSSGSGQDQGGGQGWASWSMAYHVATSAEAITVVSSGINRPGGVIAAVFSGVDTTTPIGTIAASTAGTTAAVSIQHATTSGDVVLSWVGAIHSSENCGLTEDSSFTVIARTTAGISSQATLIGAGLSYKTATASTVGSTWAGSSFITKLSIVSHTLNAHVAPPTGTSTQFRIFLLG